MGVLRQRQCMHIFIHLLTRLWLPLTARRSHGLQTVSKTVKVPMWNCGYMHIDGNKIKMLWNENCMIARTQTQTLAQQCRCSSALVKTVTKVHARRRTDNCMCIIIIIMNDVQQQRMRNDE